MYLIIFIFALLKQAATAFSFYTLSLLLPLLLLLHYLFACRAVDDYINNE